MSTQIHNKSHATGFCDVRSSALTQPDADLAQFKSSIAQLVFRTGAITLDDQRNLIVPVVPLRELPIGIHRLCPDTNSALGAWLDAPTIRGYTAVLVGPRHVLTAAHCIAPDMLMHHHFIFGRTDDSDLAPQNGRELVVPKVRYHVAKRLLGMGRDERLDWALIELFDDVDAKPLPLGRWRPERPGHTLGHPLGLPLRQASITPLDTRPPTPNYFVEVDSGSGGSGSPIIQDGAVVGIISGAAFVTDEMLSTHGEGPCIDPSLSNCTTEQPFTPTSPIDAMFPHIFGW